MHSVILTLFSKFTMAVQLSEKETKSSPKPSCSYHCIIGMALTASPSGKLPVNEIYKYILTNFPYFRTAADNWKNSVRHCLSLGQSFHKVTYPGILPYKKGFHWQMDPDKSRSVHQEIYKYLATTGQSPESYGISTAKLGAALQGQQVPETNRMVLMSPSVLPTGNGDPTISMCTVSPSIGLVELQLNPSDLEVLHKLGQPASPNLSPLDYNLLMNPNMQQQLQSIMSMIRDEDSSTKNETGQMGMRAPSDSYPSSNTRIRTSTPIQMTPTSSLVTPSRRLTLHTRNYLSSTQPKNLFQTPPSTVTREVSYQRPHTVQTPPPHFPQSILYTPPPTLTSLSPSRHNAGGDTKAEPIKEETSSNAHTESNQTLQVSTHNHYSDVEYSVHSPLRFVADCTNWVDEVIIDDDEMFPFICSESEHKGDISLNELNTSDWDTEEPIPKGKSTTSREKHTTRGENHIAFEPVDGDWNSWKEPSYINRINSIVDSQVLSVTDDPPFSDDPSFCPFEDYKTNCKRGMEGGKRRPRNKRRSISHRRRPRPPNAVRSGSKWTSKVSVNKSLKVSIPFKKLMTSRQAKKYCR